ncbi:hypothetical protein [Chryseobacterium indologenes]|uniref:hypothetical protein n=1 Tax=Chryseobacterium indologenes TaxID=253 RepID=UPI001BD00663|nr:hypothetical protein [Chryseobacterium indologenes]
MIINQLYILDWYDDIITSVTLFEDDVYIFNCIHKDFNNGEKTYYCVKIDEISSHKIWDIMKKKKLTTDDWNSINVIFEKNNKKDHVFLLKAESLFIGSDIIFRKTKNSDLRSITFPFDISTLYTDQNNNERYI